jgi:hypothetical protein
VPNPYQADDVKWTDRGIAGAGWPSEEQSVNPSCQAGAADFISVAGHSLGLHQAPMEGRYLLSVCGEGSGLRRGHALETLPCPHAALLNASGLCPQTLLGSARLGGGAATGHLVTMHQGGERERGSNQTVRLRGFCPDVPAQPVLDIHLRKEHRAGSPLCGPVRRWAPSLPSAVTQSQSGGDQTLVPA